MPLYVYGGCGCRDKNGQPKTFERFQAFTDPPVESCPDCGQPVQRIICAAAFTFKGFKDASQPYAMTRDLYYEQGGE